MIANRRPDYDFHDPFDDLGKDGGRYFHEQAAVAKQVIYNWGVEAVGRRPLDYAQRDLLAYPAFRDRRNWRFQELHSHPPTWMFNDMAGFSEHDRQQVVRLRVTWFDHLLGMLELNQQLAGEYRHDLAATFRCFPVGAKFVWRGSSQKRASDICRRVHQCPFCFARKATEVFKRINDGLRQDAIGRLFLSGHVRITEQEMRLSVEDAVSGNLAIERRELVNRLTDTARWVGATGGIVTLTCGPDQVLEPICEGTTLRFQKQRGIGFRAAILCDVPLNRNVARHIPEIRTYEEGLGHRWNKGAVWKVVKVTSLNALRSEVFGTIDREGLFQWPSWSLCRDPNQWRQHADIMQGARLFEFWGDWRDRFPKLPSPSRRLGDAVTRRGMMRSRSALQNVNRARDQARTERVDDLLTGLSELIEQAANDRREKVGRQRIEKFFQRQGKVISQRDARELACRIHSQLNELIGTDHVEND